MGLPSRPTSDHTLSYHNMLCVCSQRGFLWAGIVPHHTLLSNHTLSAAVSRVFLGPASRINWLDPGHWVGGSPAVQLCTASQHLSKALPQVENATVQSSSATDTTVQSSVFRAVQLIPTSPPLVLYALLWLGPCAPDMSLEHTLASRYESELWNIRWAARGNPMTSSTHSSIKPINADVV